MDQILNLLLGVVGLLAVIGFVPPLAARLAVPSTVLLAAAGAGIGVVSHALAGVDGMGPAGDVLRALDGMEVPAEAFLWLFLPVLLFETALGVDARRMADDAGPVLLMAVVAVLVCTVFIGFALWPVSPVGLTACLMLGAILATTDPAAVIGVFRDLGAPRRLTVLVEGESLLNDAAAIAAFGLLLAVMTGGREPDLWMGAVDLAVQFLGGMAVGFLVARALVFAIPFLRDMVAAEVTLTVAGAYVAFIAGQLYAEVSGVVAVVTAALVVGSAGRTRFSAASWAGLRQVWEQLGFWATSLLFVLAGMLVPSILADLSMADLGRLAVLVAAALAARAVVLWGLLPILSLVGAAQRVSTPYKAVMLWGGLRGAVSVALALAVTENDAVPEDVQRFVAVLGTGYVLFTLLVQGTTLRPLMRLLGLDRLPPVERALRNRVVALAVTELRDEMLAAARDLRIAPQLAHDAVAHFDDRLAEVERDLSAGDALTSVDRQAFGLVIVAAHEQELVIQRFEDGLIGRRMVARGVAETGRIVDAARSGGVPAYIKATRDTIRFGPWFRAALWLHERLGVHAPLAMALERRFEQLVLQRAVLRDLRDFVRGRFARLIGAETAEDLGRLVDQRLTAVEQQHEAFKLQYPEFATELQRRFVLRRALLRENRAYRELHADGVIGREVLDALERDGRKLERALSRNPPLDLGLARADLVSRVPIFAGLSEDRRSRIARLLRPRLAVPGQLLVRRGEKGDRMFFIASGAAEVRVPGRPSPVRLGSGEFFGELALLYDQPRSADVAAMGYCSLLVLEAPEFQRLRRSDPEINAHIEAVAASRLAASAPAPPPPEPRTTGEGERSAAD
jgi:CPA1 family monovalent cation:H+ antiporter